MKLPDSPELEAGLDFIEHGDPNVAPSFYLRALTCAARWNARLRRMLRE